MAKTIEKDLQVSLIDSDENANDHKVEISVLNSEPHRVVCNARFSLSNEDHAKHGTFRMSQLKIFGGVGATPRVDRWAIVMSALEAIYREFTESHETIADIFNDVPAIAFKVR